MKLVKNLNNKKHLLEFYYDEEDMRKNYIDMGDNPHDLQLGKDYIFVEVDESKLKETQTCLNCGRENVQKYYDIFSVAEERPNLACENCIDDINDPLKDLYGV